MAKEMNLAKRLKGETPPFFKRVQRICIVTGASLLALGTGLATIPENPLTEKLGKISGYFIVAGSIITVIGTAIAKMAIEEKEGKK